MSMQLRTCETEGLLQSLVSILPNVISCLREFVASAILHACNENCHFHDV